MPVPRAAFRVSATRMEPVRWISHAVYWSDGTPGVRRTGSAYVHLRVRAERPTA